MAVQTIVLLLLGVAAKREVDSAAEAVWDWNRDWDWFSSSSRCGR
jgi:hypothetical protein